MPQGHSYLFSLQTKDHKFWQISNGNVILSSNPYFLEFSPVGWEDISIQNIRNLKYWGVDRSVSIPLAYVNDGAKIIKHIFTNFGIEESVYLSVFEQVLEYTAGVGYGFWYRLRYRAEIDLTTYSHSASKVTATTLEDGLPKYLKANEKTLYEIPVDVPEAVIIKLDGIQLHERLNFEDTSNFPLEMRFEGTNFLGPIIFISHEGESTGVIESSEDLENLTGVVYATKVNNTNSIIHNVNPYPVIFTLAGKIEFKCTGMTSAPAYAMKFRFLKTNLPIGNQNDYQIISTAAMVVGTTYSATFSINITLNENERLIREGIFFGGVGSNAVIEFTEESKFSITYLSRYKATIIKALRPQYIFQKLIENVTEGTYTADTSNFFAEVNDIPLTCGNALRGLDKPILQISFEDFFHWWDCFSSVGISSAEQSKKISFEKKSDLIDVSSVVDLAEPSNLSVTVATDFLYNELALGYPEMNNDVGALNGNEEFNTLFGFSMGVMKHPSKLDKQSKVIASCYTIEHLRISTFDRNTTDNKNDNNVFAIHILPTIYSETGIPDHYLLDRTRNASATGLIEASTVFNIGLSPHLNFKRNGPYLRSCLWKCDSKTLAYKSVDKNNKLTFTDSVFGAIVEKADENIGGLGDQFFVPIYFNITVPPPFNLIDLLDANPLQVYRFPFYGNYYKGILMEVGTGLSSGKAQNYKLLSLPENDLTKLIEYYG